MILKDRQRFLEVMEELFTKDIAEKITEMWWNDEITTYEEAKKVGVKLTKERTRYA